MSIQPAIMNKREVCKILRKSPQTFERLRPELEHRGFPKRDHLLAGWPVTKVEEWLSKRFNIEDDLAQEEQVLLERLRSEDID